MLDILIKNKEEIVCAEHVEFDSEVFAGVSI